MKKFVCCQSCRKSAAFACYLANHADDEKLGRIFESSSNSVYSIILGMWDNYSSSIKKDNEGFEFDDIYELALAGYSDERETWELNEENKKIFINAIRAFSGYYVYCTLSGKKVDSRSKSNSGLPVAELLLETESCEKTYFLSAWHSGRELSIKCWEDGDPDSARNKVFDKVENCPIEFRRGIPQDRATKIMERLLSASDEDIIKYTHFDQGTVNILRMWDGTEEEARDYIINTFYVLPESDF